MRATIRDVAEECGCAVSTVSVVLNNSKGRVSAETRKRVLEAAKALNYRPNQLAVGMVTNKTNVLGLIIPDNENPFFASLSKAIERASRDFDYSIIYGNSDNDPNRDSAYIDMFADHCVDGIIFTQSIESQSTQCNHVLRRAKEADIPLLILDRQADDCETATVRVDHRKGGYLAASHLLTLGHKRIGCYSGPVGLAGADDRTNGYLQALRDFHVEPNPEYIFEGNYQLGNGMGALEYFLKQGVTAIFACNDLMAYDLYMAAQQMGVTIPYDISIVGFDDVWLSKVVHPNLTTVRQPIGEIGRNAVELLNNMIHGKVKKLVRVLEPELIVRESAVPKTD